MLFRSIPVSDYYQTCFLTGNSKGKLVEAFTLQNNKFFDKLYKECLEHSKNLSNYYLEKICFVKVEYLDIAGEKHVELYKENPVGPASEIAEGDFLAVKHSSDSLCQGSSIVLKGSDLKSSAIYFTGSNDLASERAYH